jgi:hypothetical protein
MLRPMTQVFQMIVGELQCQCFEKLMIQIKTGLYSTKKRMKLDGREHQQMKYAELKKSSILHLVAKATTTTTKGHTYIASKMLKKISISAILLVFLVF